MENSYPFPLQGEPSDLLTFYKDSTVFLTGATGFLGKLVTEKLLRVCEVKEVCCLVRSKRGVSNEDRFEKMFKHACFDNLKEANANFKSKVRLIPGDCALPNLGISEQDRNALLRTVNVIIHCAATVRFVEDLKTAFYINCRSVRELLNMCRQMPQLKAMVHVSTAYSNCTRSEIKEEFYDVKVDPQTLLHIVENLDEKIVKKMTPILLGEWPNTYVFTKALGENIIKTEGKGLPVSIIRPSISKFVELHLVVNTATEPFPGWIDNYYGPVGLIVGVALGFLRILSVHKEKLADLIPADYVINNCLAVAYDVAERRKVEKNKDEIPIYNCVSSNQNPITWEKCIGYSDKGLREVSSVKILWHAWYYFTRDVYTNFILRVIFHYIPALFVDAILICTGRKAMVWKGYRKLDKFSHVITFFTTREWKFENENVQNLWKKLTPRDQNLFFFDITAIKWREFITACGVGGRVYLLKDPLSTVPQARRRYRNLQILNYALCFVIFLLFAKCFHSIFF